MTQKTRKKRATISEIAKLAGVSTATVSRVLNNKSDVNETTRQRILQLIREQGYRPNTLARKLSLRRTHNLGLIIPHTAAYLFSFPYFSELIQGISHEANLQGYQLLISTTSSEQSTRSTYEQAFHGTVDGLILMDLQVHDERLAWLERSRLPFVLIGQPLEGSAHLNVVDSDNEDGAYQATRHLLGLDHRALFLLNGPKTQAVSHQRERGFCRALRQARRPVRREHLYYGAFSLEAGTHLAEQLVERGHRDLGVLVASDVQALGAVSAFKAAGLRVGRDVSVIGFDDIPFARLADPPLSTVRQPIVKIGQEAARLLIERIDHPDTPPGQTVFPTQLVLRQSTRGH